MARLIGQASQWSRPEVAPGSNPRQYHFRRHAAATDPDSRKTPCPELARSRVPGYCLLRAHSIYRKKNTRSPENTKVQTTLTSASTWTALKECGTLLYRYHHITKHREPVQSSTARATGPHSSGSSPLRFKAGGASALYQRA